MAFGGSVTTPILIALGIVGLFGIITFALAAATLGTLNKRYDALQQQIADLNNKLPTTTTIPVANTTTTIIPAATTTTTTITAAPEATGITPSSSSSTTAPVTTEQKPPATDTSQPATVVIPR
jgi:hypothetical protein